MGILSGHSGEIGGTQKSGWQKKTDSCWEFCRVCDWPNKVVQLRPECADEHKLNQMMSSPWQRARTQRMLRFLGPRTQSFEAVPRGNKNRHDTNKIAVQSITEMITNRIREQISQRVPKAVVEHRTDNNMKNNEENL